MTDVVEQVAAKLAIPFTVGGGINQLSDMKRMLRAGADKVSVNTARPPPRADYGRSGFFGSQCIVAAIDAKYDEDSDCYKVYTHGGRQKTDWEVTRQKKPSAGERAKSC